MRSRSCGGFRAYYQKTERIFFSDAYDVFSQASRATTAGRRHRQLAFNTLGFSKLTVYSLVDSLPFMALIGGQLLDSVEQQINKRRERIYA